MTNRPYLLPSLNERARALTDLGRVNLTVAEGVKLHRPDAPLRTCGSCTLCCKVMGVKDEEAQFDKPKDQWCVHAKKGIGCGIYETRPSICRNFQCLWLAGEGDDHLRPDKVHGFTTRTTDGKNYVIHEDPGYPGQAHAAFKPYITRWLKMDPKNYVIIVTGRKRLFIGQPARYEELRAQGVEEVREG